MGGGGAAHHFQPLGGGGGRAVCLVRGKLTGNEAHFIEGEGALGEAGHVDMAEMDGVE
jgi:hypothetical protein